MPSWLEQIFFWSIFNRPVTGLLNIVTVFFEQFCIFENICRRGQRRTEQYRTINNYFFISYVSSTRIFCTFLLFRGASLSSWKIASDGLDRLIGTRSLVRRYAHPLIFKGIKSFTTSCDTLFSKNDSKKKEKLGGEQERYNLFYSTKTLPASKCQ